MAATSKLGSIWFNYESIANSRGRLSLLARWRWWRCWTGRLINLARWPLERDFDNNGVSICQATLPEVW